MFVSGCSKTSKLSEGVVANVGGTEVSQEEYDRLLNYYLSIARAEHDLTDDMLNTDEGTGMTLLDNLKAQLLDTIISTEIIINKAKKEKIQVNEEELEELFQANHMKMMEEDEDYKNIIEENNLDAEFIKEQIRKDLMVFNYRDFFVEKQEVDPEEVESFYEENSQLFDHSQASAKHILVGLEDEELAKDIIKRLEDGENFEELAREYSIDESVVQNDGHMGYFGKGAMVPEFEEAVFSLEIGKISQPVQSQFGYHVIIVEDRIEEIQSFEEAKPEITIYLKQVEYQKHIEKLVEETQVIKKEEL